MSEEALTDDQSHYEVSLTAGQAFLAFVLLLLSLAASFAFGLLIGRGQGDDRLTARKDPAVVNEAPSSPAKTSSRAAAVAARDDDFKQPEPAAKITEAGEKPPITHPSDSPLPAGGEKAQVAQVLSTSDQKTAEALAAKLIDGGFNSAYVERGTTAKGIVYRVRVKFPSESEARAAVAKLSAFSKDVWITR